MDFAKVLTKESFDKSSSSASAPRPSSRNLAAKGPASPTPALAQMAHCRSTEPGLANALRVVHSTSSIVHICLNTSEASACRRQRDGASRIFRTRRTVPLAEVAAAVGAELGAGADPDALIDDVRTLSDAGRASIAFFDNTQISAAARGDRGRRLPRRAGVRRPRSGRNGGSASRSSPIAASPWRCRCSIPPRCNRWLRRPERLRSTRPPSSRRAS